MSMQIATAWSSYLSMQHSLPVLLDHKTNRAILFVFLLATLSPLACAESSGTTLDPALAQDRSPADKVGPEPECDEAARPCPTQLEEIVVSATRTETPVSELARSVSVVEREEIERQSDLDRNLGSILGKTVPGFGPSTQSLSNFGQTLRGRDFLTLIDGVPQTTQLRTTARDLNTIDPEAIERIEVVRGGLIR